MRKRFILFVISLCAAAGCSGGSGSMPGNRATSTPQPVNAILPRSVTPISTAAPHTFVQYSVPTAGSRPVGITVGPDRLYFAEYAAGKIGSLSYTGSFGEVSIPDTASGVGQLAEGVDGNIFFDEASGPNLGRYSPIAPGSGTITEWNDFLVTTPDTAHLVSDPNGVIWFAEYSNNSVVRMTTWGSILSRTALSAGSKPWDLTIGADSASVWVTEQGGNKIAKFNLSGTLLAEYAVTSGSAPYEIATGADGNVYFTENVSPSGSPPLSQGYIGRVSPSGTVTMTTVPSLGTTSGIASGSDGNIWFLEYDSPSPAIAQLNISTLAITEFPAPGSASTVRPQVLVSGADGQLWFTTDNANTVDSFQP